MTGLTSLFRDFRNQVSWGRVCAAVALLVAARAQFQGADVAHIALWLSVALGNYGASKLTEILSIGAAVPFAPGAARGCGATQTPPEKDGRSADGGKPILSNTEE